MDKNYISWLKQLLAGGPFSQSELARRLGVTFAALNRWLQGHARPRKIHLAAIQKLHREMIGYPSINDLVLARVVQRADRLKRRGIWGRISGDSRLQEELLLEHTYNSTAIEGTTFTKNETKVVLFGKGILPDKSLIEHLEVTNHAAVLRDLFQKKYRGPVTERLIKELHRNLMQGIREDAGEYSRHQRIIPGVRITLTHPSDIPEEMRGLIRFWRSKPLQKTVKEIAQFHVRFERVHPFGDGNGRVGRLIMALQCLQEGYPPVVIENARKAEYYDVLEYAQRKSERPFLCFLVEEMERTGHLLKKYL